MPLLSLCEKYPTASCIHMVGLGGIQPTQIVNLSFDDGLDLLVDLEQLLGLGEPFLYGH